MFNLAAISAAASAVAHSHLFEQANPPLPDPIGPVVHPGDEVALNPQPLPPRDMMFGALSHRFDTVALNPQPLPPREALLGGPSHRFDTVALNPQPLPPREALLGGLSHRFDTIALNPQPLPPREALLGGLSHRFDTVALNPQPLPPREALAGLSSRFDTVALNPQPLPPRDMLFGPPSHFFDTGGVSHRGSFALLRDALEQQLQPTYGLNKALTDALLRDPLAHRRHGKDFFEATRQQLFIKGAGDVDAVSYNDIHQQRIGDCFVLGSLAAVARQDPQRIRDMVVDNGNGTYTVTFKERHGDSPPQFVDVPITVTADFPGGLAGDGHAASGDTGWGTVEIWPLVIEKAYGQYLSCANPYGELDRGGSSRRLLEMITGRPATSGTSMSIGDSTRGFDALLADFQAGKAIVVSTNDIEEKPLIGDHAYAVSDVYRDANGNQWVQLYNPWGVEHATLSFDEVRKRQIYLA